MISHKANFIVSILLSLVVVGILFFWFPEVVIVGGAGFFFYGLFFAIVIILLELIRAIRKRPLLGLSLLISVVINFAIPILFGKDCDGCFVRPITGFPWPMYVSDYGPENNTGLYLPFIFNLTFWTIIVFSMSAIIGFIVKRLRIKNR